MASSLYHLTSDQPVSLGEPKGRSATTAFTRLAVVHALSSAGDAMVTMALAGSVFFDVSTKAAQSRVALSLVLTVAPFVVVGPFLGPMIDRVPGGRRAMVLVSGAGRGLMCLVMAGAVHSLLLFPLAFVTLVCSKIYLVAKASLVPTAVGHQDQLVQANSKLAIGSSAAGLLAAIPAVPLLELVGAGAVLRLDAVVFALCVFFTTRLRPVVAERVRGAASADPSGARGTEGSGFKADAAASRGAQPAPPGHLHALLAGIAPDPGERRLPPGGLQLAALAMGSLRAMVGLVTFMLVFALRRAGAPVVWYGLALGASQLGNLGGAGLAPRLRTRVREELMLTGASAVVGIVALVTTFLPWEHRWPSAILLALSLGLAAASAKLAFDSMVQRDAPLGGRSRMFARFETGFQLSWVVGSLVGVLVRVGLLAGLLTVAGLTLAGAAAFAGGSVKARRGTLPSWWPGAAARPIPRRSGGTQR